MIDPTKLCKIQMFSRLSGERLAQLAAALVERAYADGQVLFHKGDPGDEMFIVEEGGVGIFTPHEGDSDKETPIRIFSAGETLGEMALIDGQPRTLSARATAPARTLVLNRRDFQALLHDPDMALAVMSALNDRIRYTTDFLGEVQSWVGRVAEGEYRQPFQTAVASHDSTLAGLAAQFTQMAARVKQREEKLRQEIAQLRIEIDETKREKQVAEITESDYFKDIQARARHLREKRKE